MIVGRVMNREIEVYVDVDLSILAASAGQYDAENFFFERDVSVFGYVDLRTGERGHIRHTQGYLV